MQDNQKVALRSCIDAIPTDGLGVSNSDLEQIGASSYNEVDELLQKWFTGSKKNKNYPVILRHEASHFKRNHPYNFTRKQLGLD